MTACVKPDYANANAFVLVLTAYPAKTDVAIRALCGTVNPVRPLKPKSVHNAHFPLGDNWQYIVQL